MIDIADSDPDGAADVLPINQLQQKTNAAEHRHRIVTELEQIGAFPAAKLLPSGNKPAHFLPVWKGSRHGTVCHGIPENRAVKYYDCVNTAVFGRSAPAIAALKPDEQQVSAEAGAQVFQIGAPPGFNPHIAVLFFTGFPRGWRGNNRRAAILSKITVFVSEYWHYNTTAGSIKERRIQFTDKIPPPRPAFPDRAAFKK